MKAAKLFLLFIAIAMVITAVACGQKSEVLEAPDYINDGEINFDGRNIMLALDGNNPFGYEIDSTLYDMLMNRFADVGSRYNCKLTYSMVPDILGKIRNAGWTDSEVAFDMLYIGSDNLNCRGAFDNLFCSLTDSEYVDVTNYEKYGVPTLQENCMVNGTVYGVIPNALPMVATSGGSGEALVIINEKLVKKYAMTDPRDLYENGAWTLDNFRKNIPEYYFNDGATEVFSYIFHPECWGCGYIGSYGIRLFGEYEGEMYSCINHPLIHEALEESIACREENKQYLHSVNVWDYYNQFNNEDSVMCMCVSSFVNHVCSELEDFGLTLFPVSRYIEQGTQYSFSSSNSTMSIPVTCIDSDSISFIMSEVLDPFDGYDREAYEKLLFTTTFFDMRDVKLFLDFPNHVSFMYACIGGTNIINSMSMLDATQSVQQALESYETKFNSLFDQYMRGNFENNVGPYLKSLNGK